jgi:putative endonuclease
VHARGRLGALGEELAAAHFRRLGFRILERNVRSREGEIDLIAFDGHTLVFAEIKTARASGAGRRREPVPLEWLAPRQRLRITRLARAWLADPARERPRAVEVRFDAVGVLVDSRGRLLALEHLEGAW